MDATNLIVYLPFDNSPTEDLCGNEWTIVGSLAVEDGALALESSSTRNYIYTTPPELGMSDFTIDWWEYIPASVNSFTGEVIGIDGTTGSNTRCLALVYWRNSAPSMDLGSGAGASWSFENKSIGTKIRDQWVHRAVVRSGNTIYAFENGTLFTSVSFSYSISVSGSSLFIGNIARENRQFVGKLKNVRIHVGSALWTENFTPPTAEDYAELQTVINEQGIVQIFRVDVENRIVNALTTWRYENYGTADTLIVAGTTLTALPKSKSLTSSAFYQTTRAKCFDIPATPEIWIKFDVYFNGSARWRAYNDKDGEICGVCSYTNYSNGDFGMWQNNNRVQDWLGICKKNQLQTVLLHMISGSSAGVIEAWVDGEKIYTYTGDVNHGENFADIYLQSDGAGTFFSNIIISNGEIGLDENIAEDSYPQTFLVDVECKIRNTPKIDTDNTYVLLNDGNYFTLPDDILPGAKEFTISAKFSTTSTAKNSSYYSQPTIIGRDVPAYNNNSWGLCVNDGKLCFWAEPEVGDAYNLTTETVVNDGEIHKVAVRSNADGSLDLFCDGEIVAHKDDANVELPDYTIGAGFNLTNGTKLAMNLYEVQFWDNTRTAEEIFAEIDGTGENLQAWYLPTEDGLADYSANVHVAATVTGTVTYMEIETVFVDVEYESTNDALAWRYEDCAVYIGTGKPINFHVPKAYELWIKFDVYFDGVARWYAYDDGFEGMTGITALTTLALDYLSAGATVKTLPDVCKTKQTQTFLVHMISGATNGLIEVWAGLEQLESFSGNVNNGRPFVDFMLRSDDAGTSFTELIVSNTKLNPDEKPANVLRATKTSQLNVCNTETGVIWLLPGGDYPFPYITYTIREVIRQTIEETVDIGEAILQPINSVWAKFDIFNDGINRWWFYNLDENFGKSGVCALANGDVNFIANEAEVQQEANLCAVGQWQSFIVHMESDEINGLIEITTDNVSYTYTGNVNGGKEFTDVYLLSESDKVVFDNFIVSTAPLDFDTKLKRVKTTETANPTLALNVHHNGENILIPFKLSAVPILNATAIRWLGADWYNKLVEFSAPLASEIPIFHDGKLYALSKE